MSKTWTATESEIIHHASKIVGAIGAGDTLSANEYTDARNSLNLIIKGLYSQNLGQWSIKNIIYGQDTLTQVLGTDGTTNYYSIQPHTATSSDIPTSGNIYEDYWRVGGSAGTTQAVIGQFYDSSNQQDLPSDGIAVDSIFFRDGSSDYVIPQISWSEYQRILDKNFLTDYPRAFALEEKTVGPKTIFFVGTVDTTAGGNTQLRMHINYRTYYDDSLSDSSVPDFPASYQNYLVYELATALADLSHLPLQERSWIKSKAEELKDTAFKSNFVESDTSIQGLYGYSDYNNGYNSNRGYI